MYTDTHIHVHRHTHTCTQTHIHTDTQTHTYTDTYTHRHRHIHTCTQTHIHTDTHIHVHRPVFLISSYGAPLAQRASYLALHIFLFGPVMQLIMIMLSLTALSLSELAQDVFSMAHTLTIFEPICPKLQNLSKTLTQTHTCIHTDTQTHRHTDIDTQTQAQTHRHTHTCTDTYIHTHTHHRHPSSGLYKLWNICIFFLLQYQQCTYDQHEGSHI